MWLPQVVIFILIIKIVYRKWWNSITNSLLDIKLNYQNSKKFKILLQLKIYYQKFQAI